MIVVSLRRAATLAARFAAAGGLIWFALSFVDLQAVWSVLGGASLPLLAVSLLVLLARLPVLAWRWRLLLASHGAPFGAAHLTLLLLVSQSVGTLVPGAFGLDLVRGYYLHRLHVPSRTVVSTVVADRLAGIVALLLISLASAALAAWTYPPLRRVAAMSGALGTLGVLIVVLLRVWRRRGYESGRFPALSPHIAGLVDDLAAVASDGSLGPRVLSLSVAAQALGVTAVYLAGLALSAGAAFASYLLFVPLIWLWTLIPVSIGGVGLREGAFLFFFGMIGMAGETALAISLVVSAQTLLQSLIGASLLPFIGARGRTGGASIL